MKYLAALLISFFGFINFAYSDTEKQQISNNAEPAEIIKYATGSVINELQELTVEQRTYAEVQRLVKSYILPTIDQEKIAKLSLGKHWRKASKKQRTAFIDSFRELQIRTYTGAFAAFDGQKFEFDDTKYNKVGNRAIVKGQMIQPSGQTIPIDFKMYINDKKQWLVYDAVLAGLGFVKTYRQQLSEQLQQESMDDVIAKMQNQLETAQR